MCRLTQEYSRKMKKKFCGAPTWRLLIRSILVHVFFFSFSFLSWWLASLHYVWIWLPVLYPTTHPVGVDIRTFADASLLLIQPLEDFFNSVFVMAVSLRLPWKTCAAAADDYEWWWWRSLLCFVLMVYYIMYVQEDERVRNNRLALLRKIESLPKGIADLSVLPGF